MVLNKLDVDRGCNENLYGDRGTHMPTYTHIETRSCMHTGSANERISLIPDTLTCINTFIQHSGESVQANNLKNENICFYVLLELLI